MTPVEATNLLPALIDKLSQTIIRDPAHVHKLIKEGMKEVKNILQEYKLVY